MGDAGLTGRKIIVDTYGGWGAHGGDTHSISLRNPPVALSRKSEQLESTLFAGGAFSGKDYTKVDRSAAYAARWVAKSLVKAGLAKRCLVQVHFIFCSHSANILSFLFLQCFFLQVSYAIGVAEPLSVTVFDYGTGAKSSAELNEIVKKNFDLRYVLPAN